MLGPVLFLILMSDIDIGVLNANVFSFADDTRLYSKTYYIENLSICLFLKMYLLLVIMLMPMSAQICMLLTISII